MTNGILYIVATPIGNLEDMTFRAIRTLEKVDLIACEDTRVTRRLLDHYKIKTETVSFYHPPRRIRKGGAMKPVPKLDFLVNELKSGKNIALVTDAGTPGISDPGNQFVAAAVSEQIPVIPVPGVSALTTLASVSGIDLGEFVYLGFPPHKKGRETFFKKVVEFSLPVIYFDSIHRVLKNLELLKKMESGKQIILGRELTKMFEEIVRGGIVDVLEYFESHPEKIKGEFVIIVY